MQWCNTCVLPDTRPHLEIMPDGKCSACHAHEREKTINWAERKQEWEALVEETKAKKKTYDIVLAVSGGKDSWWQTKTCLDYGLHPLAVTWRPPMRTRLGQENLDALRDLGVDHIDFAVNPKVEQMMHHRSLMDLGADSAMHLGVFSTVARFAYQLDIPLVVWSENSATTYSGVGPLQGPDLTMEWVKTLGSTHGREASDYLGKGLSEQHLAAYDCPTAEQLAAKGIRQVFLGYYLGWDGNHNFRFARSLGFKAPPFPMVGYYAFADIDDPFVVPHHMLKMWKYGFSRSMDNLSQEIRNGRMGRPQAIEYIRVHPQDYDERCVIQFCGYIGITLREFYLIAERFRNLDIWEKHNNGEWRIKNWIVPGIFDWNGVGQQSRASSIRMDRY
jgi:N-acetyl sugar amidotransferase